MKELTPPQRPDAQALAGQLVLLDNTRRLLLQTGAGVVLQLRSLEAQRRALLCGAQAPCADALGIGASVLFLCSVLGFQRQTGEINAQACREGRPPDCTESALAGGAAAIAWTRLLRLLARAGGTAAQQEEAADAPPP